MTLHRTTHAAPVAWSKGASPAREEQAQAPLEGHHNGRTVRVPLKPRPRPSTRTKKGAPKARKGRAGRSGGARGVQAGEGDAAFEDETDVHDEDVDGRFQPTLHMDKEAGSGGGGRHGSGDDGRGERRDPPPLRLAPARPRPENMPGRLLAGGVPGSAELFGAQAGAGGSPHELMAAMAALVLSSARSLASGLAGVALSGQQAAMRRLGAGAPSTTLADVKGVLLAACARAELAPPARPLPERTANQYALLPLVLLNPSRPRTARMVDTAVQVAGLLLRTHRP
jgi:hypothetical protein